MPKRITTRLQAAQNRGFFFLGNALALDFLNTRPVIEGKSVEMLPDFAALLRWFRAARLLTPRETQDLERRADSNRAREVLHTVLGFRERLREAIIAWERGNALRNSIIDELNNLMAAYPMRTRLQAGFSRFSKELWFDPRQPEDLLAPLAYSAATLFAEADRNRVRQCAQCVLHFHDTSKKGTRRWCSMQLCGNRSKVAAYAARQRRR
ncbi:MAG TPA: ABATE domain-containing protein [Terriglobales bacterium]